MQGKRDLKTGEIIIGGRQFKGTLSFTAGGDTKWHRQFERQFDCFL
jgi:hypothetical protein